MVSEDSEGGGGGGATGAGEVPLWRNCGEGRGEAGCPPAAHVVSW